MKIKYRQPSVICCGIYALANALNDDLFLNYLNEGNPQLGHNIFDLNNILRKANADYHLDPIYVDINHYDRLPDNWSCYPNNPLQICPLLLDISYSETSLFHMVAIHSYNDKTIGILDSLKEELIQTTWDKIYEIYPRIHGVWAFRLNIPDTNGWVMLS